MKKKISTIVIFVFIVLAAIISLSLIFASSDSDSTAPYGEFTAKGPVYAKFVQIKPLSIQDFNYKDFTIETLGYSEIRVFVRLFNEEYKTSQLKTDGVLKMFFSHEMTGMGTGYKNYTYKDEVTSYIDGWATEKIYGRKMKIALDADNIPKGKYTLYLSYYLLP